VLCDCEFGHLVVGTKGTEVNGFRLVWWDLGDEGMAEVMKNRALSC
jgi:hypothetical protein